MKSPPKDTVPPDQQLFTVEVKGLRGRCILPNQCPSGCQKARGLGGTGPGTWPYIHCTRRVCWVVFVSLHGIKLHPSRQWIGTLCLETSVPPHVVLVS